MKNFIGLAVAGLLALSSSRSMASLVVAEANSNSETNFDGNILSTDLINQGQASLASLTPSGSYTFPASGSNDGTATHNNGLTYGSYSNPTSLTYNFNLNPGTGGSATGYDITSLNSIYGWQDSRYRHAAQEWTVSYATLNNASFTPLYHEVYAPYSAGDLAAGSTQVTLTDTTGLLLTHVTALRYTLFPYGAPGDPGYSGEFGVVREFDAVGAVSLPEPSSFILAGLGVAGLIAVARRRKGAATKKLVSVAIVALGLIATTDAARGALIESDQFSILQTGFDANILNNDQIENGSPARSGVSTTGSVSGYPGTVAPYNNFSNLTDGQASTKTINTDNNISHDTYFDGGSFTTNPSITYTFSGATGLNLSSINSISGWADTESFSHQVYQVWLSHVGSPTDFGLTPFASVDYNPWATNSPGAGGANSTQVTLTDGSGFLSTNVAAIKFTFSANGGAGQVFREIDVVGVPEPSSFILAGLGAVGLFIAVRRRRKA